MSLHFQKNRDTLIQSFPELNLSLKKYGHEVCIHGIIPGGNDIKMICYLIEKNHPRLKESNFVVNGKPKNIPWITTLTSTCKRRHPENSHFILLKNSGQFSCRYFTNLVDANMFLTSLLNLRDICREERQRKGDEILEESEKLQ
jgi:hypothetical protein